MLMLGIVPIPISSHYLSRVSIIWYRTLPWTIKRGLIYVRVVIKGHCIPAPLQLLVFFYSPFFIHALLLILLLLVMLLLLLSPAAPPALHLWTGAPAEGRHRKLEYTIKTKKNNLSPLLSAFERIYKLKRGTLWSQLDRIECDVNKWRAAGGTPRARHRTTNWPSSIPIL